MTNIPRNLGKTLKMRPYVIWILVPISTAFLAGYLSLYIWNNPRNPNVELSDINLILDQYTKKHSPFSKIDFSSLYPDGDFKEFLDPNVTLPQTTKFNLVELKAVYDFSKGCSTPPFVSKALEKTLIWHLYKCGQKNPLRDDFFYSKPYVHPSGSSFAWLNGQNLDWLLKHLHLLHALELKQLKMFGDKIVIPTPFDEISNLSPLDLKGILDGQKLLISSDFVMVKQESEKDILNSMGFDLYPREGFDKFLSTTTVSASIYKPGSQCFLVQGSVCWEYRPGVVYKWTKYQLAALFLGTLITLTISLSILDKKSKSERLFAQKLKFGLQTLTHELRTPVTSISLSLENMRQQFDELNPDLQISLLRALNDLERLKHTTEKSRKYLNDYQLDRLIEINKEPIVSLESFLQSVTEPFSPNVVIHKSQNDSIESDPYWLGVCVTNLVKNAVTHGAPPVNISYTVNDKLIEINISDDGNFKTVHPKQDSNKGLGLGIYIVETALKSMNGRLKISENPTTFTILLERT